MTMFKDTKAYSGFADEKGIARGSQGPTIA